MTWNFALMLKALVLTSVVLVAHGTAFAKSAESCRDEVVAGIAAAQRAGSSDTDAYRAGEAALTNCMSYKQPEQSWMKDNSHYVILAVLLIGALWFANIPKLIRLSRLKKRLEKMTPAERKAYFDSPQSR